MGARSNLATRGYHQDTKHPGARGIVSSASSWLSDPGQIDGALFCTDKILLFVEPCFFSGLIAGCSLHERTVVMLFHRDMEPPCVQGGFNRRLKMSAQRVILGRLWFDGCILSGICKAFLMVPLKRHSYYSEEQNHFVNSGQELLCPVLWLLIPSKAAKH